MHARQYTRAATRSDSQGGLAKGPNQGRGQHAVAAHDEVISARQRAKAPRDRQLPCTQARAPNRDAPNRDAPNRERCAERVGVSNQPRLARWQT